ncbi:hypothetical protein [Marinilabilia rubra]|uniref:SPOR domain-containing protein n=1 Tax=Marinilabilia rubra TaxID=2162893 RepID=A0A2U2BBE0_9BACT|nr:hypothetical protein [Marinilabilia rubra]PWE00353.1 hypothetical protein DDZ16_05280 [Marinilabilia rubra]
MIRLSLNRNIGGKNKAALVGQFASSSFFQSNQIVLGEFPTMEEAQKELASIEEFLNGDNEGVYPIK